MNDDGLPPPVCSICRSLFNTGLFCGLVARPPIRSSANNNEPFLSYLIAIKLVSFLALAVTHCFTWIFDGGLHSVSAAPI